ncbi:type II secretion system protein GspL [Thalassotalea sp. PLHSN55]|uniref:type II secretion system protein GspL n=1 Tax=Thalassotalea sp. PLHSN55 TaxID=3435888 RepID=UPI003F82902E
MSETLFIRLGSKAEDKIHWLIWSAAAKEIIASGELASADELSELTEKSQSRTTTVFVPGCDVALKSLTVPGNSSRAIRLAAPYMLEDDLAQDVDELFFAYHNLAKNDAGENCFVAGVAYHQLEQWQAWLAQANIFCRTMLPDVLAMPVAAEGYNAIGLGEQVIVRQGQWQGQTIDNNAWSIIATQWQRDHDDLTINNYSPLPEVEDGILALNEQAPELPMALLAKHASEQSFNLLQGEFQVKKAHSATLSTWLWVAGIAVFALCLQVAIKGGQLWQLNNQQAAVEQQIIETYKKAFPTTKRVRVNTIKPIVRQKLGDIMQSSGGDNFVSLLLKVEPAFAKVPELRPQTLKFDSKRNEIRIQALGQDYQSFERFKVELENAKLDVSQGSQSNQGDKVSGSFSIKG